jgi:hypothetical protein
MRSFDDWQERFDIYRLNLQKIEIHNLEKDKTFSLAEN